MPPAVGDVFHLRCQTCRPPKFKFFVVALADPLRFFLINSRATDFQKADVERMRALAEVLAEEHRFLHHDSLVGCNELFSEYSETELVDAVANDPLCCLGSLSPNARAAVFSALQGNKFIPRKYLSALLVAWA